jgi:hypothetical protein
LRHSEWRLYGASNSYLIARSTRKERSMFDAVLLISGLAFFALSIGYALACDRL